MRFTTLFFNAMRVTTKIDCRRFTVEVGYAEALQKELCGELPSQRCARTPTDKKAAVETRPWALSH